MENDKIAELEQRIQALEEMLNHIALNDKTVQFEHCTVGSVSAGNDCVLEKCTVASVHAENDMLVKNSSVGSVFQGDIDEAEGRLGDLEGQLEDINAGIEEAEARLEALEEPENK